MVLPTIVQCFLHLQLNTPHAQEILIIWPSALYIHYLDMANDYEMVHLAEREDPRDCNTASSSTALLEPSRQYRISRRLFVVHFFHSALLVLCITVLVAGLCRWEHRVSVNVQKATQVASYISVAFQAFFTASILILFWLSRNVAIDDAIRHPQTLLELDMRLQAWAGLGPSLTNWLYEPGRLLSRLSPVFSIIPIYFVAGTVLQITSSGVLGKFHLPPPLTTCVDVRDQVLTCTIIHRRPQMIIVLPTIWDHILD
ncbi:hypothetical protein EV421DRAFT_1048341 [Armillaria borealis]|uniref:Uncharacterized protein n=1 Tax=Armillaria borealis TaxID=47425 RepID=A0AA39K1U5_9AGAR|nr:hypothetical protein EV421DRAFT_1048341 [Armillaria borealis]